MFNTNHLVCVKIFPFILKFICTCASIYIFSFAHPAVADQDKEFKHEEWNVYCYDKTYLKRCNIFTNDLKGAKNIFTQSIVRYKNDNDKSKDSMPFLLELSEPRRIPGSEMVVSYEFENRKTKKIEKVTINLGSGDFHELGNIILITNISFYAILEDEPDYISVQYDSMNGRNTTVIFRFTNQYETFIKALRYFE